jgi:hypothetical protein
LGWCEIPPKRPKLVRRRLTNSFPSAHRSPPSSKIPAMKLHQFRKIAHLEGLDFIRALLSLEEKRFKSAMFIRGSTYEDINADFGIFPTMAAYPVYFAGDIRKPKNKHVFIGINPGFNEEGNSKEQAFLGTHGSFEGYCRLFGDFRFERKGGLIPYYANIAGFLRRYHDVKETMNWDWFQEHFINLELIPYHSVNANGLRINDVGKYRAVYFEILLKLLHHINPTEAVFINGFPTCRRFLENKKGELLPEFRDVMHYSVRPTIAVGQIGPYKFFGLPFLNRPKGGVDLIVNAVRRAQKESHRRNARRVNAPK